MTRKTTPSPVRLMVAIIWSRLEFREAAGCREGLDSGARNFLKAEPVASPPNKIKPEMLAYARCSW